MPRYIIECDDPSDIILGMKAVRTLMELTAHNVEEWFVPFYNGSVWHVKKTKTGYSARARKT